MKYGYKYVFISVYTHVSRNRRVFGSLELAVCYLHRGTGCALYRAAMLHRYSDPEPPENVLHVLCIYNWQHESRRRQRRRKEEEIR